LFFVNSRMNINWFPPGATALATAILWIVVRFVLPIVVPLFLSRIGLSRSGGGIAGAFIGSGSILLAALLGFVGGLVWILSKR
jgi:hypothetical protein